MTICFSRNKPDFEPITIDDEPVEMVKSAKIVGITIQHDLKWDMNTDAILKKTQKRLLKILRKSGASEQDLFKFYTGIIRPVC